MCNGQDILISVIMAVYNTDEKYFREAIESILNQTFRDFELLIGDDGSDGYIREVVRSFSDPRIKYHKFEHGGAAKTRNRLIDLAKGQYMAIMDSDDIAVKERFELQYNFLEEHPEISICGGQMRAIDKDGNYMDKVKFQIPVAPGILDIKLPHPTQMIRLKDFNKYGFKYDENYPLYEDNDLALRMLKVFKAQNLQQVLVNYRILGNSLSHGCYPKKVQLFYHNKFICSVYKYIAEDKKLRLKIYNVRLSFLQRLFSITRLPIYDYPCKQIMLGGVSILFKDKKEKTEENL